MRLTRRLMTTLALAGTLATGTALAAELQPDGNSGPLRFHSNRHKRTQQVASVTPQAAPAMKVPLRSSSSRVELAANSLTSKVGYGMISFDAVSPISLNKLAETEPLFGGAVYVNGKFYGTDYDDEDGVMVMNRWYVYDALTWHLEKVVDNPLDDFSYLATDRTYDPAHGVVYSVCYDKSGMSIWLATTNLADGKSTLIAPLEKDVIMIASDAEGQLFGIDVNANLYKISSSDAALTLVGNLNVGDSYESPYISSCTIDAQTGKMYWAEFTAIDWFTSRTTLYEVNTSTASAVAIGEIPGGPELAGLYVTDYIKDGVPQAVSDLSVLPQAEGSLNISFSFKAPVNDVDGNLLSGKISVEVTVDNDLVDIAECSPGETYTTDYIAFTRGLHTFKAVPSNDKGAGVVGARMFYAGWDVPAAPSPVVLTADGNTAHLSWSASTTGADGGAIRQPVTYNINRYPGNVAVATGVTSTSWSGEVPAAALYYFTVTPVSADGAGNPATSNKAVIGSFTTPYLNTFDTEDDFNLFTIEDHGSNGKVWNYDETNLCMRHPWSLYNDIDDAAISPAIILDASKSYSVSFDAWQMIDGYDEHVMLYYGTSPHLDDMTFVMDTEKLPAAATNYSAVVAPMGNGPHYFALRSTAGKNGFMSYADNFSVQQKGLSSVPAPVSEVAATPAPAGELKVNISFTAPSTCLNGDPLDQISRIEVTRGIDTRTLSDIVPGQKVSIEDTPTKAGTYIYSIVVWAPSGASEAISTSAYVGVDTPEPVTDVVAELNDNFPVITWTAPAQGVNGGNLQGLLSYNVTKIYNGESTLLASGLTDTSYTDEPVGEEQAYLYYEVTAVTSAGQSEPVASNGLSIGRAYGIPLVESFPGASPDNNPWSVEYVNNAGGGWSFVSVGEYPYAYAADSDGGCATFEGYHTWSRGTDARLVSPVINLSGYKNLELKFQMYHYNGVDSWSGEESPVEETLDVEISADGAPFEKLTATPITLYAYSNGWKEHKFNLDAYQNVKAARVAFRGVSHACYNIHLDNISIDGLSTVNMLADNSAKNAYSSAGNIYFSAMDSEVAVYDVAGRKVAASKLADGKFTLPKGIYLLVCGNFSKKLIVK